MQAGPECDALKSGGCANCNSNVMLMIRGGDNLLALDGVGCGDGISKRGLRIKVAQKSLVLCWPRTAMCAVLFNVGFAAACDL